MASTMALDETKKVESICRLCLEEREDFQLIFAENSSSLKEWIENLTTLKIINVPNAPASLCSECENTLQNFESFREMCSTNDCAFKEMFIQDISSNEKNMSVLTGVNIENQQKDSLDTTISPAINGGITVEYPSVITQVVSFNSEEYNETTAKNESISDSAEVQNTYILNTISSQPGLRKRRSYICHFCGKGFKNSNRLRMHVRIHTKERPHKCPLCDKSFISTSSLRRHSITHSGLKPYACDKCPARYNQSSHLVRHQSVHLKHQRSINRHLIRLSLPLVNSSNVYKSSEQHRAVNIVSSHNQQKDLLGATISQANETAVVASNPENNVDKTAEKKLFFHSDSDTTVCQVGTSEITIEYPVIKTEIADVLNPEDYYDDKMSKNETMFVSEKIQGTDMLDTTISNESTSKTTIEFPDIKKEVDDFFNPVQDSDILDTTISQVDTSEITIEYPVIKTEVVNPEENNDNEIARNELIFDSEPLHQIDILDTTNSQVDSPVITIQYPYLKTEVFNPEDKPDDETPEGEPEIIQQTDIQDATISRADFTEITIEYPDLKTEGANFLNLEENNDDQKNPDQTHESEKVPILKKRKSYVCNFCGKGFVNSNRLRMHVRIHTQERPHKCQICDKSFITSSSLRRHAITHSGLKPYACDKCPARYNQTSHLARHRTVHEKERPTNSIIDCAGNSHVQEPEKDDPLLEPSEIYDKDKDKKKHCHICNKYVYRLRQHQFIHNKIRPYQCEYCDKAFTQMYKLTQHIRTHTKEKPYVCSYCDKRFTGSADLKVHIRSHTQERPFKCKQCHKAFITSGHLLRHTETHSGLKPYSCDMCQGHFAQKSHLVRHQKIHKKPQTQDAVQE